MHDLKDYTAEHIRFGMRFSDMITQDETGGVIADLSRISGLEPDTGMAGANPDPLTASIQPQEAKGAASN